MAIGSNTARTVIPGSEEGSPPTDIISVPEACKFLGVHRNTLYKLIRAGELPAFRMMTGGRWKFRRTDLMQWLDDKQSRNLL